MVKSKQMLDKLELVFSILKKNREEGDGWDKNAFRALLYKEKTNCCFFVGW